MQTQVIAVISDMIFAAKVNGAATQLGVPVTFARSLDKLLDTLATQTPRLILVDLNNDRFPVIDALKQLKTQENLREIPVLGFLSHVQTDLKQQALALGCDRVIPRSEFSKNLDKILAGSYFSPTPPH
jgi:CheY-like chemotaxis protein